jgi:hypothetical protein
MNVVIKEALKESGEWMTTEQLHQAIGLHVDRQLLSRRLATIAGKGQIFKRSGDKKKGIPHLFRYNHKSPIHGKNKAQSIEKSIAADSGADPRFTSDKVGGWRKKELGQYPFETYLICCARWHS